MDLYIVLKERSVFVKSEEVWNAAFHQLELQLDRASFNTWLRNATFLGEKDGIYHVGVQNSHVRDMLQYRLYRNIRRVVSDIAGYEVSLEFSVHRPSSKPSAFTGMFAKQSDDKDDSNGEQSVDDRPLFRLLAQKQQTPPPESLTPSTLHTLVPSPQMAPLPESDLNPVLTFDRFITSGSNRMVFEAAQAVAEYPATVYNPFLVYGGVGLGKTHILQAIAHACADRSLNVLYIPSEVFTNDLIKAIRERTTAMFRQKYRSADILLVDDIQFIRGKDSTQEEFFHTFNALVNFNKQIVLASDRHPNELTTLQDRLRSRFQGGLVADIQPPELETRMAILRMWADERGVTLPGDVIEMVSEQAGESVRDLRGLFNQLVAQANSRTVTLPRAQHTINRYHSPRNRLTLQFIMARVGEMLRCSVEDIAGKRRARRINRARQIAMYLCRDMTDHSLPQIGEAFGGRSHTTVLHGCNKIAEEMADDPALATRIEHIREYVLTGKK